MTMMPKTWDYSVAALLFLPSLLLQCAAAAGNVYIVGDTTGWIVPPNTNFYVTWASSKTFQLNDILTFNFTTNQHDVVRVLKQSYDSCNTNNQIGTTIYTGPANVTLNQTGAHYFICSFGNHCQRGQKLAITVGSSTTPAGSPSPSSSPTGTPQPPPPPSSAAPSALAGSFLIIMLSFALGKLVL